MSKFLSISIFSGSFISRFSGIYKLVFILPVCLGSLSFSAIAQLSESLTVVRPKEIDSILNNPGIGFNTFQHFNGDSLFTGIGWSEGFPINYSDNKGRLLNEHYPETTIAYWRVYWKFLEPEQGKYKWDLIDQALDSAKKRGQKLMLRVAPYGTGNERDVPAWYRKMVGEKQKFAYDNPVNKWMVDPEDPKYREFFGGFIRALGKRYDNHPYLEAVDLSIVGAWGEGAGSELLTEHTMKSLVDAYTSSFKFTPLLVLIMDEKTNRYANSRGAITGWRADCIGDLGFWAKEQNGWNHMNDFYPQAIIDYGLSAVWKTAPVSFEICGTMMNWKEVQKYTEADIRHIFEETLKWHISSFNAKSSPVPNEWEPAVNEWLKKMGYRFVLKRITYPKIITTSKELNIDTWWENKGVAPIYRKYILELRLKSKLASYILPCDADARKWLPGDNLFRQKLLLPLHMKPDEYNFQIALVDPISKDPAIKLAIEGREADGWYTLGTIKIF